MNYDKLVDFIVQEVYKKLNEGAKSTIKDKNAVIVGEYDLEAAKRALGQCYNVVFYDEKVEAAEIVIVSKLTIKAMANLATLTGTNDEENFIIRSLMEGKKVYILEEGIEYKKFKHTAPKALYNKYLEFEKELRLYGINFIDYIGSCMDNAIKQEESFVETSEKETLIPLEDEYNLEIRNKKLISEADIRKPFKSGMKFLIIDKKSILTPLASDFIRIHNLKIKRI